MVAKKYAISAPSAAIALRYGTNVSRGIQGMAREMSTLETTVELLETQIAEYEAGRA